MATVPCFYVTGHRKKNKNKNKTNKNPQTLLSHLKRKFLLLK